MSVGRKSCFTLIIMVTEQTIIGIIIPCSLYNISRNFIYSDNMLLEIMTRFLIRFRSLVQSHFFFKAHVGTSTKWLVEALQIYCETSDPPWFRTGTTLIIKCFSIILRMLYKYKLQLDDEELDGHPISALRRVIAEVKSVIGRMTYYQLLRASEGTLSLGPGCICSG
jgi:hypothetical protein